MDGPVAYTDGACLGNPGPGGWGVRILYADGTVREFGGAATATTNNCMELQGAIEALQAIGPCPQATIVTDSRYVIDGLTRWIHNWRRRGWTTTSNTPVKNRRLWITLDRLNHPGIRWRHVRGHTGDPNNERVDDIARAFAKGATPDLFCGKAGLSSDPLVVPPLGTSRHTPASQPSTARDGSGTSFHTVRYVSIVQGAVRLDNNWESCAARVRGVSGARYKKVRSAEELAAFCAKHGVEPPTQW
jgi:ribonuclease HI